MYPLVSFHQLFHRLASYIYLCINILDSLSTFSYYMCISFYTVHTNVDNVIFEATLYTGIHFCTLTQVCNWCFRFECVTYPTRYPPLSTPIYTVLWITLFCFLCSGRPSLLLLISTLAKNFTILKLVLRLLSQHL